MRSACDAVVQLSVSPIVQVRCSPLVEAVVRPAEREPLHRAAGAADVVAQPRRRVAGVVERWPGSGTPTLVVGEVEERIVELPRVVQIEHAAAHLVDLVRAEDVRVGQRDRRVPVGALQREGRRQAGRIGERIEPGEFGVEAGGAETVVARQLPVELQRVLILRELRGDDVALADERDCRRPTDRR